MSLAEKDAEVLEGLSSQLAMRTLPRLGTLYSALIGAALTAAIVLLTSAGGIAAITTGSPAKGWGMRDSQMAPPAKVTASTTEAVASAPGRLAQRRSDRDRLRRGCRNSSRGMTLG